MDKLLELGFVESASISFENQLMININQNSNSCNVLYAFVLIEGEDISNWKVRYIGHTRKSFINRMNGYRLGHGTGVNNRIHRELLDRLANNEQIKVFCLPDNFNMMMHSLHIDIAAGLEYSLIRFYKEYNEINNHQPLQNIAGNIRILNNLDVLDNQNADMVEENLDYLEPLIPGDPENINNSFNYTLGTTYWRYPIINIPASYAHFLGEHGDTAIVDFYDNNILLRSIQAQINRRAVPNGTPRLYFNGDNGTWFQQFKHTRFEENDVFQIGIQGTNRLVVSL
jgi:hypothetical protein